MINRNVAEKNEYKGRNVKLLMFKHTLANDYITRPKKHFKNEQRSRDAAAKKRANTSGVGKINHYCEDIYIPPYNNTH